MLASPHEYVWSHQHPEFYELPPRQQSGRILSLTVIHCSSYVYVPVIVFKRSGCHHANLARKVRQKFVETGHVDIMVAVRPNFFYTRTVPCELWFFDKQKPAEHADKVIVIDYS